MVSLHVLSETLFLLHLVAKRCPLSCPLTYLPVSALVHKCTSGTAVRLKMMRCSKMMEGFFLLACEVVHGCFSSATGSPILAFVRLFRE